MVDFCAFHFIRARGTQMATPLVFLRKLGKVNYGKALTLQQSLATAYKAVGEKHVLGELLICEHDPVFTFGLREKNQEIDTDILKALGAEVFKTRRGGLTTFHGPGQLLAYPVLNLRSLKLGVRDYVRCLENSVIVTLAQFGVQGYTTENVGVWVRGEDGEESKLCAIGIQVTHGVCYHGLAINCSNNLSWFSHINPCGLADKKVTSLTELCGRTVSVEDVSPVLVSCLTKTVGVQVVDMPPLEINY